jgi:hypothetical protein
VSFPIRKVNAMYIRSPPPVVKRSFFTWSS